MRALIVVESIYGNTRRVVDAVAAGLAEHGPVDVVDVGHAAADLPDDVDLLVGGPTHMRGMSNASTRATAVRRQPDGAKKIERGVREWLASLRSTRKVAAAALDGVLRLFPDEPFDRG
jgi:hypothetical protein